MLNTLKEKNYHFMLLAVMAECFIIYASVLVKVVTIPPITLGFYRVALALPFFLIAANLKRNIFKLPFKDIALMNIAGIFFALDLLFFNLALRHTSVANVNLIASLVCFILVPIGIIFFGEKMKKSFLFGGLITILGVFILIKGKGEQSIATPYGDFLAFLSVVFYSLFLAIIYGLRRKYGTLEIMSYACIGSSITMLALAVIFEGFAIPQSIYEWSIVLLIVFCGQIVGQGFFNYIMGKVNTQTSSLLLLFSPVIAALMGFVFLGEKLGIFEILGICIIITGIYFAKKESY